MVFFYLSSNDKREYLLLTSFLHQHGVHHAWNFIKKETLAQVFSCEFCETFNSTFFHRRPPVAPSEGDWGQKY